MKTPIASIRALLQSQSTLVLATAGEDGLARSTPLFYLADDALRLYWFSSRSSLHSKHCARNPEATVAVFIPTSAWQNIKGVQMQGRISIVKDRARRQSIVRDYAERFQLGNLFTLALRRSALYCFVPAWVRYLHNSRHFGDKIELRLPESNEN